MPRQCRQGPVRLPLPARRRCPARHDAQAAANSINDAHLAILKSRQAGLEVPAGTAPNSRFRIPRTGAFRGGFVELRAKALPGFRFQVRGSDIRCELRIDSRRAVQGGVETMQGPSGEFLRVQIPVRVKRGEIIRVANHGMPKARGGRGDLLVRVTYRPEVSVSRTR